METLERNEWADVAQLVEITSDAVIICELDGTILHVNNRLLGLMCEERADVIGGDVKDVLYSSSLNVRRNIVCHLKLMAPRTN